MRNRARLLLYTGVAVAVVGLSVACDGKETEPEAKLTPAATSTSDLPSPTSEATDPQPITTPTQAVTVAASTSRAPITVSSDDGSAELEIPPGALPVGIKAADVSISRLSPENTEIALDGEPPVAAYELQPDGLQLEQPIQVTLTLSDVENVVPTVVLLSGEMIELVPVVEFRFDTRSREATVLLELGHFSRLAVGAFGFFKIEIDGIPDQVVNVPFTATAHALKIRDASQGDWRHLVRVSWAVKVPWTLTGIFGAAPGVEPGRVEDAPSATTVIGDSLTVDNTFVCTETGTLFVDYRAEFGWTRETTVEALSGTVTNVQKSTTTDEEPETTYGYTSAWFECLPPPTPTPTSTPTASPSPTATPTPMPLEWFANLFVAGPDCVPDPIGDNDMLSDPSWTAKPVGWTDIECSSAWIADGASVSTWFEDGGLLECGATDFAEGGRIVCSEYMVPVDDGPVLISRIDLAEPPPMGPGAGAIFTYALVADGDGDPTNNFEFQGTFALDLFQGTDTWYMLGNDPESGEVFLDTMDARGGAFEPFDTAARVILFDSSVVFVIPLNEFDTRPDQLGIRQTAFSFEAGQPIDGTGSMDTAGADGPDFVDIPFLAPPPGRDIFADPGPKIR